MGNMNGVSNKRGSSRRKGDEFQDLTALRLILELYSEGADFSAYLEYEKVEAIDDVVILTGDRLVGVQVKYSIDPLAVYITDDFTDPNRRTFFGRYAKGWLKAKQEHPDRKISVELISNRGRDSSLEKIIGSDGRFATEFIAGKIRSAKIFRQKLQQAFQFEGKDAEKDFEEFLTAVQFCLGQRPLNELRAYLQGEILDHKLGISDPSVFYDLKQLVEHHAIDVHVPVVRGHLDQLFLVSQRRFLVPQVFPVDQDHFVEIPTFEDKLLEQIQNTDSGYIVVTGLPGSGKSTSLSEFFNKHEAHDDFEVCRYFCFVSQSDDAGRLRLEAESLRVNVLSELHRKFGEILDRQHDYSENQFLTALGELGRNFSAENRKLVILLDGLDHVERDPEIRESLLRALPPALPLGVLIVVGTQELKYWQPLALREGRQERHVPINLFTLDETREFLIEKHRLDLEENSLRLIFEKSQGLPLYLRYVAIWLKDHDGDVTSLSAMPEIGDGDIRRYYESLWANLERDGMSHGRYLCGVLATLKFPVSLGELPGFQKAVPQIEFQAAFRAMSHLLRKEAEQYSIFHDSFRVFVTAKLDPASIHEIVGGIFSKLKTERGSPRWFSYVFQLAFAAQEDEFLQAEVNRPFVDFALLHCRPPRDIIVAIDTASKSAARKKDLVALARLGSLKFRTKERIDQFSYSLLARVQLALGRVGDVMGFCCRQNENRWLVNEDVAEQVLLWCAETGNDEFGRHLYTLYREAHEHLPSEGILAIYSKQNARVIRWLSGHKPQKEMLERADQFLPLYAPQLLEFFEKKFTHTKSFDHRRYRRIHWLFPNHLVRHILLRLVAKYRSREDLKSELEDYLKHTGETSNLEIAGYAALCGKGVSEVRMLAGAIELPPESFGAHPRMENLEAALDKFQWTAVILGYENNPITIRKAQSHIGKSKNMYSGYLRFLLQSGICLSRLGLNSRESYQEALNALSELKQAGEEPHGGEMEILRACRPMLPEALFRLSVFVSELCPDRMDDWRDELVSLRACEFWTSHWGYSESHVDYSFELRTWDRLKKVPGLASRFLPILNSCAETYATTSALKGGSRSDHFLWLAAIAASCGWRKEAETWREKGTLCSLSYGYHKDTTLYCLIDVLDMLRDHEPLETVRRSGRILEMAKFMPAATDNRETKEFEQSTFQVIAKLDRNAAFALIRFFQEHAPRWKLQDCIETFCKFLSDGDPETLWILKDVITPHNHEKGSHSKQVINVAKSLREMAERVDPGKLEKWKARYVSFIRTNIDPGWWPDEVLDLVLEGEERKKL